MKVKKSSKILLSENIYFIVQTIFNYKIPNNIENLLNLMKIANREMLIKNMGEKIEKYKEQILKGKEYISKIIEELLSNSLNNTELNDKLPSIDEVNEIINEDIDTIYQTIMAIYLYYFHVKSFNPNADYEVDTPQTNNFDIDDEDHEFNEFIYCIIFKTLPSIYDKKIDDDIKYFLKFSRYFINNMNIILPKFIKIKSSIITKIDQILSLN